MTFELRFSHSTIRRPSPERRGAPLPVASVRLHYGIYLPVETEPQPRRIKTLKGQYVGEYTDYVAHPAEESMLDKLRLAIPPQFDVASIPCIDDVNLVMFIATITAPEVITT